MASLNTFFIELFCLLPRLGESFDGLLVSATQRQRSGHAQLRGMAPGHPVRGGGVCAHHARTEAAHRQRVPAGGLRGGRDGRRRERRAGAQERRHRHRHGLGQRGGHGGERARAARQQLRLHPDRHSQRPPCLREPAQGHPVSDSGRLRGRAHAHPPLRVSRRAAVAVLVSDAHHFSVHRHRAQLVSHDGETRDRLAQAAAQVAQGNTCLVYDAKLIKKKKRLRLSILIQSACKCQ